MRAKCVCGGIAYKPYLSLGKIPVFYCKRCHAVHMSAIVVFLNTKHNKCNWFTHTKDEIYSYLREDKRDDLNEN